jgi:hypothetical protein
LKFEANLEVGFVTLKKRKERKQERKKERKKDGLMQVQDSKFHVQLVNKVPKFHKLLLPQASSPSLKIQS